MAMAGGTMGWNPFKRRHEDEAAEALPFRLGLALGGGAVRGAAHLGVLAVLEREGIGPDVVTGTSVGAVLGAGIAGGLSAADMMEHFRGARWSSIAKPAWRSKLSMLDTNPLGAMLSEVTNAETFADLSLPLAVVASDLLTGTSVVITDGSLSEAIRASTAIPGLFEPVRRGALLLVDGGITDNLPVAAAKALGATYVIAVDIMPPQDGTYEPQDIRDMVLLSLNILQREAESGRHIADLVIAPDVVTISLSDFGDAPRAYEAGVKAAEALMPLLREDLARLRPEPS